MPVFEAPPPSSALALLPGATFADAFAINVADPALDAETAARRSLGGTPPRWIAALLVMRDVLVCPFGLKTREMAGATKADRIDFFPCLSRSPERVILGLDDTHLDFRIAIDASPSGAGMQRITLTTVVRPHNLLGRIYLAIVMPFHKLIAPAMLARTRPQT